MSTLIITTLQLLFSLFTQTRDTPLVPDQAFILELTDQQYSSFPRHIGLDGDVYDLRRIHPAGMYYRLRTSVLFDASLLRGLERAGHIGRWKPDRDIELRNTPNDPLFSDQWDMERIGLPEAWNRATGGVTVHGDTIVVAILDTGFDADHEDLDPNVWRNHGEIPGDGIDNDQNGYVDDYLGLNVKSDNDQHTTDLHGTAVAGIVGARGGNGLGICGVNWNVKLLLISGIQKESDIIEGYIYARMLRNTYRNSNGTQGAFVVATSLSAGIDNALAEDHPMWCEQYDQMGNAGILSVCATTNSNSDVDAFGDMPSTCPSDYMIAVTNTGMNDQKLLFAGFGKIHVDLGAPGTPTLSTDLSHGYDDFEGTSAAAPHVSGAIALLYSGACSDLLDLADSNPGMLARQIQSLLLDHVDAIPELAAQTVTGGRLNVANAFGALESICGSAGGALEILSLAPNPSFGPTTLLTYHIPNLNAHSIHIYDAAGRLVYEKTPAISIPGEQSTEISTTGLPPGVYHVAIHQGGDVVARSLLIQ